MDIKKSSIKAQVVKPELFAVVRPMSDDSKNLSASQLAPSFAIISRMAG